MIRERADLNPVGVVGWLRPTIDQDRRCGTTEHTRIRPPLVLGGVACLLYSAGSRRL